MVEDWIDNLPSGLEMHQLWHPCESFFDKFSIRAFDAHGVEIPLTYKQGWYSEVYGSREEVVDIKFSTSSNYIRTLIVENTV